MTGPELCRAGTLTALLAAALAVTPVPAPAGPASDTPRIAIIIDDLGYQLASGRRAVALPGPVACAVLPGTPLARRLAEAAFANGKDVLLHLPLESMQPVQDAAPGRILLDMTRSEFAASFAGSIASVPHVAGVSNHQGSLLTQHPGHMAWLMQELATKGNLFFVDSYTTHRSIALELARENNIPAARRDVFLDADRSPQSLEREFERLKQIARRQGMAVGIGHPYPETLDFLERELPRLAGAGFELVGISEYIVAANTASGPGDSARVAARGGGSVETASE